MKISYILPVYKVEAYLRDCVNSIIRQTYKDIEIILVDDGSPDGCPVLCNQLATEDNRIKVLHKPNGGLSDARNAGLKIATGEYIVFMDSDDLWLPEKLERQVRFMEVNGFHFTYTCYSEIDGLSKETGKIVTGPMRVTKKRFLLYNWVGCLTVMYNREFIGLVQIEDVRKNNDYALWLKVGARTDCHLLKECLAKYRRGRLDSIRTSNRFFLLKWYYKLFYVAEGFCPLVSVILVVLNMICGCYKKLVYEQKIKRVG
jgi:glycosyltransferase involved in cell wall biosynthesis